MIPQLHLIMTWTQTIPLAILICVPFADEELRTSRRAAYLLCAGYFIPACVLQDAVYSAYSVEGQKNFPVSDLTITVMLAVFLCIWALLVKAPAARKVIVAGMIIHYAAALTMLASLSGSWRLGQEEYLRQVWSEEGSMTVYVFLVFYTLLTWPLVRRFFWRILRQTLPVMDHRENRRALLYMCLMFAAFCITSMKLTYRNQPSSTMVAACTVAAHMVVYYSFFRELDLTRKRLDMARQMANYQLQYQTITSRMEGDRRLRHDLRHHFNMLSALSAQGRTEDIALYLKEYGKVYEQMDQKFFCGDLAVDNVLGYYMAQAGADHISMNCDIRLRKGHGIEHTDMTVLLGNCLENAMEAVKDLPEKERRITVELQSVEHMVLLRTVNSCPSGGNTEGFIDWTGFPSRKKAGRQGVGLRSVSEIAAKYGGSAQFQRRDGEFTTRVSLCTPASEKQQRRI